MTTRNAREFQGLARIPECSLGSKLTYPDELEHIALDQPGFDVVLFGKSYNRAQTWRTRVRGWRSEGGTQGGEGSPILRVPLRPLKLFYGARRRSQRL